MITQRSTDSAGELGAEPTLIATPETQGMLRKVVVGTFLGALVFGALALYADIRQLTETTRLVSTSAVVAGCALALANYLLRAGRFHYYLRRLDADAPAWESVLVFLCGFAVSMTPGKVGEVWKSVLLRQSRGISIAATAPIVVAERITDLIGVALLAALSSVVFERGILLAAVGVMLALLVIAVCSYRPLGQSILDLTERVPGVSRLTPRLRVAYDSLVSMLRPDALVIGTLISFVAWGAQCGSLWVIARGFPGIDIGLAAATFAYAASTLAGAAAMIPGGLGVTEAGMTSMLLALGGPTMTRPIAMATTLVTRVATLWFAVAIGLIAAVYRVALSPAGARGRANSEQNKCAT